MRELTAAALRCQNWDEVVEQELVFLGLIGTIDSPREGAKQAVKWARAADSADDVEQIFLDTPAANPAALSFCFVVGKVT